MSLGVFQFGEFELDSERFELFRAGRSVKVERKTMELLMLLVSKSGQLVTREQIAESLWPPEVFVDTEHGINSIIRKIRVALRDDSDQPRFVQTVTGKGYRFIAPIARMGERHSEKVKPDASNVEDARRQEPYIADHHPAMCDRMLGKLQFGVYELDRHAMELRKHGVPIRLQEQSVRVLAALMERPGQMVTREELRSRIWGEDTFVDFDHSLNKAVNRVREVLNDNASAPQYIETVPRRGYRFIAPVAAPPHTEAQGLIVSVSSDPAPAFAQSIYHRSRSRMFLTALTTAILLAAIGITTVAWLRQPKKAAFEEPKYLKSRGWLLSGDSPSNYEMGVDPQASYRGSPSAYLKAKQPSVEGSGTLMQEFSPGQYAGKRVRLSAFVKAEEVRDWAGLWMRVEKGPTIVGFDNMKDRPIKGTTTWQNYEVVLDVPRDATEIAFGILLSQSGTVWLNGVKFESVGRTNLPLQDAGPLSGHGLPVPK